MSFSITLNSTAEQEGEAVLMRMDSGGNYAQVDDPGAVVSYPGDQSDTWTVPASAEEDPLTASLPFAEGHSGSIEHLKVRYNYTYPNGETGYIESDPVTVCLGTFVSYTESFVGGSGFQANFAIDTEILPDPSKVTCTSATIEINGRTINLNTSISDGVLTVGALFEEILEAGETINTMGPIKVTLNYNDGDADWTVDAEGEIDRSPQIYVEQILVGSTLNGPGGLRSTLIEYGVVDSGATISGHSVKLIQGEYEKTWNNEGSGDFTINDSIVLDGNNGYLYYPSTGMEVEITVWYSFDEETWLEKTETFTDIQLCNCGFEVEIVRDSSSSDGVEINGKLTLDSAIEQKSDDPCGYSVLSEPTARIQWLPEDPSETPNAVGIDFEGMAEWPMNRGETRSFFVSTWAAPSWATGYRLFIDSNDASGTMGTKTYTYQGTLTGSVDRTFPEPATLAVTVTGGQGTLSDGSLSASGTATITCDADEGYTGAKLQSFCINWYDADGNLSDYEFLPEEMFEVTGPASSDGKFTFNYSISGVTAPSDAYGFTVEIFGALLKDDDECEWPSGESDKAEIVLAKLFESLKFTPFYCEEEEELEGDAYLISTLTTDDLAEGAYFKIYQGNSTSGTTYLAEEYEPGDTSIYMFTMSFRPVKPNDYYVQAFATYRGHEYASDKVKLEIYYPSLESSSEIEFIDDCMCWLNDDEQALDINVDLYIWVDPDYEENPTFSLTNYKLVWSTGEEIALTAGDPIDEGYGDYTFNTSLLIPYGDMPSGAESITIWATVTVTGSGGETYTKTVSLQMSWL